MIFLPLSREALTETCRNERKRSDYPQELLNLFDKYVHGDIDRRDFLDGAKKFAVGGVTAAGDLREPAAQLRVGAAGAEGR